MIHVGYAIVTIIAVMSMRRLDSIALVAFLLYYFVHVGVPIYLNLLYGKF